ALFTPEGKRFPMAAVLPGEAKNTGGLRRFGYAELLAQEDSLLFRAGERFPVHAFHYWDASVSGSAFRLEKPLSGRSWCEGCAGKNLYAAFPHLYFAGAPLLAERFVRAAMEYGDKHEPA
ncbi:MAG: cobyrinic acid a,c-diamide synthase, partial [Oscillospiraceae bacterium]|nr:cobyrinic acid a,c-diamide synthase [Oscillospiraceae bacterium]